MKFSCRRKEDKELHLYFLLKDIVEESRSWHKWFAWRPVRVGPNDCRWLERVEKKYPEAEVIFVYKASGRPLNARYYESGVEVIKSGWGQPVLFLGKPQYRGVR